MAKNLDDKGHFWFPIEEDGLPTAGAKLRDEARTAYEASKAANQSYFDWLRDFHKGNGNFDAALATAATIPGAVVPENPELAIMRQRWGLRGGIVEARDTVKSKSGPGFVMGAGKGATATSGKKGKRK